MNEKLRRMNGVNGMSDIEGKAVGVAASESGQRVSFNWKAAPSTLSRQLFDLLPLVRTELEFLCSHVFLEMRERRQNTSCTRETYFQKRYSFHRTQNMLPVSTLNSVKERDSNGALRSQLSPVRQEINPPWWVAS